MTTAAAAAAAQYCCSTTKRMPRHYYCVREVQALISLASPPFGLRAFYAHARTMVDCTVLAVFLTGLNFPPKGNLVYIYTFDYRVCRPTMCSMSFNVDLS